MSVNLTSYKPRRVTSEGFEVGIRDTHVEEAIAKGVPLNITLAGHFSKEVNPHHVKQHGKVQPLERKIPGVPMKIYLITLTEPK